MNRITDKQITDYLQDNISSFHNKRLKSLNNLELDNLLRRKNPYLFRSKNLVVVCDLIKSLLDAHLSSQEETLFGGLLEGLAIHVAGVVFDGWKSNRIGIDLEFIKDGTMYIVQIKSGPNWGNSSQIARMRQNFQDAVYEIRQDTASPNVVAVNGCCYGRDPNPDKGDYFKYCGQAFWELLSNEADFFTRIVEPLGHDAKKRNDDFALDYATVINRLAIEFSKRFCTSDGRIDWNRLVAFSSARLRPRN